MKPAKFLPETVYMLTFTKMATVRTF